jgi:hypothetical protein
MPTTTRKTRTARTTRTRYKPSEARYAEGGKVQYLVYHSPQRLASGRSQERTRVKRMYFPGDATDIKVGKPGTVTKRTGTKVFGVPVHYRYKLAAAKAQRGKTVYRLPARPAERTKVIELPRGAKDVRLTTRPPKGPLQAVA